ncbi:MAG: hypothetical protein WD907_02055 [Bacilli bacterium]
MDKQTLEALHQRYYTYLKRYFPLYKERGIKNVERFADEAISKAIARGLKFNVLEMEHYMEHASSIYFKAMLAPSEIDLNLPKELVDLFVVMDHVYEAVPDLREIERESQVKIWSEALTMDIFQIRLLYHCYRKVQEGSLRQVDVDLTVTLLPPKKRGEFEVLHQSLDKVEIITHVISAMEVV